MTIPPVLYVVSFGYGHGDPPVANLVVDVQRDINNTLTSGPDKSAREAGATDRDRLLPGANAGVSADWSSDDVDGTDPAGRYDPAVALGSRKRDVAQHPRRRRHLLCAGLAGSVRCTSSTAPGPASGYLR